MPNESVHHVPQSSNTRLYILVFVLVLTIVAAFSVFFFDPIVSKAFFSGFTTRFSKPTPTPTMEASAPTPSEPRLLTKLPQGSQTYTFSHGDKVKGPKPATVTLDPLSTTLNQKQSITITVTESSPVTKASVFLTTDTKKEVEHVLTKKNTTDKKDTWTGSWTVDDTIDQRYEARLYITSSDGVYDNTMRFR